MDLDSEMAKEMEAGRALMETVSGALDGQPMYRVAATLTALLGEVISQSPTPTAFLRQVVGSIEAGLNLAAGQRSPGVAQTKGTADE